MRTETLPNAPLTLPYNTFTRGIDIPRRDKVLDLHVDMPKHMQPKVLGIDEIRLIDRTIFVVEHRNVLMLHTGEAQVHHLLAGVRLGQVDNNLIPNGSTIVPIQVTTSKDKIRLVTLEGEVHEDIVECFLNVRTIDVAIKVVMPFGSTPADEP